MQQHFAKSNNIKNNCQTHPGPIHEGVGAPEPAKAGTPNVWRPGFSRFVWRFTSKVGLHELALTHLGANPLLREAVRWNDSQQEKQFLILL
jgi:hypothetical protein